MKKSNQFLLTIALMALLPGFVLWATSPKRLPNSEQIVISSGIIGHAVIINDTIFDINDSVKTGPIDPCPGCGGVCRVRKNEDTIYPLIRVNIYPNPILNHSKIIR